MSLRTDTFFGVFSLGRWGKESTVERISLALDISGSFTLETLVTDLDGRERSVDRRQVGPESREVAVPDLAELGEGLLWFRMTCESDEGRVRAFEITTDDEPARDVHLGVAITTFNRMPYVAANIARMAQLFKAHPDTAEDVSVLIVDNARNLELPLRGGVPVEIVPNPNLGGAGGFARGLWEHRRRGQATHVLFMDDDIAFEPEVIARTVSYLRYAADPETCVAGSMMRMDRPFVQFEAGADYDPTAKNLWEARGRQQNLLYTDVLLANERLEPFDYGAWWFYAFPLTTTDDYPPPLFVRGDDVYWGLRHTKGKSIAMNGVGVWHADFDHKNGPTSAFYENRNVPIITALAYPDFEAAELRRRALDLALRSILSFRYDWAEATLDGVEAFLDGPEALMEADPTAVNDRARSAYRTEVLRNLSEEELEVPEFRLPSRLVATVMRPLALVTLGGNLLPRFVRRRGPGRHLHPAPLGDGRGVPRRDADALRDDRGGLLRTQGPSSRVLPAPPGQEGRPQDQRRVRRSRRRVPRRRARDDVSDVLGTQVRRATGRLTSSKRRQRAPDDDAGPDCLDGDRVAALQALAELR